MGDKYGVGGDPACYPGTDVLQNRLGLRDPELLAAAEAELAAIAVEHVEIDGPPFDFPYLCALHRQLFGEVYEWAGEIRAVDISKGSTRFCTVSRIVPEATRLLDELAGAQYFLGLDRQSLVRCSAELYGELNMVHPFRDGNGRTLRLFLEHVIVACGHGVAWGPMDREEWISACIAAVDCNYEPLITLLDRCIGSAITDG